MEICGELMTEKLSVLKHLPSNWLQQQTKAISSCKEQPSAALLSSFTEFGDEIVMTDIGKKKLTQLRLHCFISVHQLTHQFFLLLMRISTYEAGQRVLKLNRESGARSSIQFSNIGILGLPYWLSIPLERVFNLLVIPFSPS